MSVPHPLDHEITSRGLRRAALDHDMRSAINRWQWTRNGDELATLVPEQLVMLIISGNVQPGHPLWLYTEERLGRKLIPRRGPDDHANAVDQPSGPGTEAGATDQR